MSGIPITLYLKKLRGGLLKIYIFLKNPYGSGDTESGIEELERFHTFILQKDEPKSVFSPPPSQYEPMLEDRNRCSLDSADIQLFRSIVATRLEIRELLVVENSEISPEETECR
jgi:hypothetical protein